MKILNKKGFTKKKKIIHQITKYPHFYRVERDL